MPAHAILSAHRRGESRPQDVWRELELAIKEREPHIHAFVSSSLDHGGQERPEGPLPPIALKSNICVRGREVTCCSRILTGFRPPYDATVVRRLTEAGCPVQGLTNMDEFAFGSSTENSAFGVTRNPWDVSRVAGGSSGGSAAAVAAGEAVWALGSDTGGSIRQPASFCGVVGLKPTYGRVSRYGLIAFASSLDQIGPLTRDVEDAAHLLEIIAGPDPMDSTCVDRPVEPYRKFLGRGVRGMRLGIPREYFVDGLDPEVKASVETAVRVLEGLGAECLEISLPHTRYCVATYYIIATAEASSNLARYDGVRYGRRATGDSPGGGGIRGFFTAARSEGFGPEAKRRIMLGTYVLSSGYYDAYYLQGLKARTLVKRDFDRAFAACDAILTPTSPTTAFRVGERADDPLAMYLSDVYTISANLAGIPAISLPCGFSKEGLPIGLQVMAAPFAEGTMLRVAHAYEQATDWHTRRPQPSRTNAS